jgi:excinuclease UvrABC ATPase subunit
MLYSLISPSRVKHRACHLSEAQSHNVDERRSKYTADWIVDLGPEGGDEGGSIVAQGTPEEVARMEASHTGAFLRF